MDKITCEKWYKTTVFAEVRPSEKERVKLEMARILDQFNMASISKALGNQFSQHD